MSDTDPNPATPVLLSSTVTQQTGQRRYWGQLYGSSDALAIAEAAMASAAPLVVVTPDTPSAQRLEHAIAFFCKAAGKKPDADPAPAADEAGRETFPVLTFPDWETLPYDIFSPHQDIISDRLATLARLPRLSHGVLIVPVATLLQRLAPTDFLDGNCFLIDRGQTLDLEATRSRLDAAGYRCVSQVIEHGEFAIRGSIIDLFPMGHSQPFRIELFDDEVESIRTFDPESQRSIEKVDKIRLLPAREFPFTPEAITRFRHAYRTQFAGDLQTNTIYNEVSNGNTPPGIEYYLPLFFEQTHNLLDYLPGNHTVITTDGVQEAVSAFWADVEERYEQGRYDTRRPLLPPNQLFFRENELFERIGKQLRIELQRFKIADKPGTINFPTAAPPQLTLDVRAELPSARLSAFLADFAGRVLFCAESTGRRETLLNILKGCNLHAELVGGWAEFLASGARYAISVSALEEGLVLPERHIALIAEPQLFGEQVLQQRRRQRKARDADQVIKNLVELEVGAPVVHEDNGVGRYLGLETITHGDMTQEFLTLEYAGGDKLFVPVSHLHLISRYTGASPESAPLHRLGSGQWEKAKRKAREKVRDVAAELLSIYAQREARKGHVYHIDENQYAAFCASFPFEETPDQQDAIEGVFNDLRSDKPMDRLVCGDVGFGKTEVAMRAAFIAVQDGKQVAMLVPTTLLAQQHFENFQDRFSDWPVRIASVSRFRSRKEQTEILKQLESGNIDIIIGTHKLIQNDIKYKRLGLVIIDEEHRFGVRQKERFKALRSEVDLLTLTATPIPRTLNMSMAGLRDLSIIATAPARRLAVKTFVSQWNDTLLKEACLREIRRGGQVFFLHNSIDTIEKMRRDLEELVPEAKVETAHGQMRERELEQVMADFYHHRFNILVCTTIIETGIDIPNANTIIINRADNFGLAQLYQLRGRVGRSHHQAYAYLVVPPKNVMTADAVKRLEAIESIQDLGAGFTLATHDMEIRGAGELLGEGQSGRMQEIGFTLYLELLERAVKALKEGREPELDRPLDHGTEIDLGIPALLPDDYLPDVHTRLIQYKRIASANSEAELRELQVEMIDRFGLLPEATKNLFSVTELKLLATPLGIKKVEMGDSGGRVQFVQEPNIDPMKIITLIQTKSKIYRMDGQDKLRIIGDFPDAAARFAAMELFLHELT
ncbi:MAG: transcription-repair coupling factor [Gammaproteobacteria bacterium]|nr:transcription-repair coupling factor [Gammaproteobacteria bacterium]